jgi:predicted alpha-1,2-mannosidase
LPDWLQYGYITPKFSRAVSRAIDYSLNDFALSQMASNPKINAEMYLNRSRNWRNHWDPEANSLGFNGFVMPRNSNGSFMKQDPLSCGGCYWGDPYYEALPWEYSLGPHHDIAHLIQLSGGPGMFVERVSTIFKENQNPRGQPQFGKTIFDPGNEPSFASPYLFNFASRQDLSVLYSKRIAKAYYSATPTGLPGDSDAGAMQSWLLWNMIGLYPLTSQTTFLIGAPWFSDLTISLAGGKQLKIISTGGNATSDEPFYVQSLKVNGKAWRKSWVAWDDVFENGGIMEFKLGPRPADWATGELPPSPAS